MIRITDQGEEREATVAPVPQGMRGEERLAEGGAAETDAPCAEA